MSASHSMTSCQIVNEHPKLPAIPRPCGCTSLLDGEVMAICRSLSWSGGGGGGGDGGGLVSKYGVGGILAMQTQCTVYYV